MRFNADNPGDAVVLAFNAQRDAVARGLSGALRDVTASAVLAGRQSIAAGGFGPKWQNALRGQVFPKSGASLNAAGFISHKIPYAGVFENGAIIAGQPTLWLPFEKNLPADGRKWSPRLYIQRFGQLELVKHAGRKPLLFDPRRKVFVFVGVPSVALRKRFDVEANVRAAVANFDAAYNANFKVE